MRGASKNALLYAGASSEAKIMQTAAQQRALLAKVHSLLKGLLDQVTTSPRERGHSCWVPAKRRLCLQSCNGAADTPHKPNGQACSCQHQIRISNSPNHGQKRFHERA